MAYISHFECLSCQREFPPNERPFSCSACGGELSIHYDLGNAVVQLKRDMGNRDAPSISRFRALLPLSQPNRVVTMFEGGTPLLPLARLGKTLGITSLYGKDETRNPTCSFKDRPISVAISVLRELGASDAWCVSGGGNTGTSAAAYCARAGMRGHIFVPSGTPRAKELHMRALGADLKIVQGTTDEVTRFAAREMQGKGFLPLMTRPQYNPYSLEGCKTMIFEIMEQAGENPPDLVVLGVGTGTNLAAAWKGISELRQCSMISRVPRLVAVQSAGCMPLVDAFNRGLSPGDIKPWHKPRTIASGLVDSYPDAAILAMRALVESNGMAVSVTDDEILDAELTLAKKEGIFAEPSGAASIAGVKKLAASGKIANDDRVVCVISGSGLKQLEVLEGAVPTSRGALG